MKIFSKEETDGLPRLKQGRHTFLHKQLFKLKPGESLLIEKGKHWVSKTSPHRMVKRFGTKNKRTFSVWREENEKGWFAERIS